jgi:hypothetical protein
MRNLLFFGIAHTHSLATGVTRRAIRQSHSGDLALQPTAPQPRRAFFVSPLSEPTTSFGLLALVVTSDIVTSEQGARAWGVSSNRRRF